MMFSFSRPFILKVSLALALAGTSKASVIDKRDNVGQGTFYATGLGVCGIVSANTDFVVAVSKLYFDSFPGYDGVNPNNNPLCRRNIKATYQGRSVTVEVVESCEACAAFDLAFSPAAFETLANPSVGRISGVDWVLL